MSNKDIAEVAGEITEEVVETTLDVVEAVPSAVITVVKNNPWVLAGVAVASAAVGAGVTLYFSNRHFKALYQKITDDEIAEVREHYSKKFKDGDYSDPTKLAARLLEENEADGDLLDEVRDDAAVAEAADILTTQGYVSYDKAPSQSDRDRVEAETSVRSNIFDTRRASADEQEFILDDELDKKRQGKPYIVEVDEYMENENGFTQISATWYEEDGVLAEEDDEVVEDLDATIGGEGNLRFGAGSNDSNTVYIFNPGRLNGVGYEIVRDTGSYSKLVLGLDENGR